MRFIGCHGCVREGDVGVSVESGCGAVGTGEEGSERCVVAGRV